MVWKESAETQDYVYGQDMEVDNNKNLEEIGFVQSAVNESAGWHETLRFNRMCDKKCNAVDFKIYEIASILVEDDGKPHTINLCRN